MIRRAETAIKKSKERFIPLNDGSHEDAKLQLIEKLERLRGLMLESPINDASVLTAVEDLEIVRSFPL